jgi:DNA-binding response OmpR family regulator
MSRILIVDDDQSVRKVLRFRLKNSYELLDTGSPEEAIALALQHKPDAILLDLMMPRYSGFEVCQTLASMSFTQLIPIFIVSGESASRYKDFCENLGAKGYFQKPIDFDALEARLVEVLNGTRHDRRAEPRVRLRMILKICGTTAKGEPFEFLAITENVSAHGFFCGCNASLQEGAIVDVFLMPAAQQCCGRARVTRVERPKTSAQSCGFQFVDTPVDWVLQ